MNSYEVEIKSLLGEEKNANELRTQILEKGGVLVDEGSQLNHYFLNGDFTELEKKVEGYLNEQQKKTFDHMILKGSDFSVRTRQTDKETLLVIKASVDDSSSANGIARLEFEEALCLSIDELDQLLLDCGFAYQAKWSRKRESYEYDGLAITLDKNAGYGWLSEFEKVVSDPQELDHARDHIQKVMNEFSVVELAQDRLARMFDHYNKNWESYYGTDNIFTIE